MVAFDVRPVTPADRATVDAFLAASWADFVARRGELIDARRHQGLIAEAGGDLAGVMTLVQHDDELEVLTLDAVVRWQGVGSALLTAAIEIARSRAAAGCGSSRPTTTSTRCGSTSGAACASRGSTPAPWTGAA